MHLFFKGHRAPRKLCKRCRQPLRPLLRFDKCRVGLVTIEAVGVQGLDQA